VKADAIQIITDGLRDASEKEFGGKSSGDTHNRALSRPWSQGSSFSP
jgi:hypothetical protein